MHLAGVLATALGLCAAAMGVMLCVRHARCVPLHRQAREAGCADRYLYEGECLYFSDVAYTYYSARTECQNLGMKLYGPDTRAKMLLVHRLEHYYWLNDDADAAIFRHSRKCTYESHTVFDSRVASYQDCDSWAKITKVRYICARSA